MQAFIRQYLDMVGRWFRPGSESVRAHLDDHRAILKELRRVVEKDGDDGVHAMVSADRAEVPRRARQAGEGVQARSEGTAGLGGKSSEEPRHCATVFQ